VARSNGAHPAAARLPRVGRGGGAPVAVPL